MIRNIVIFGLVIGLFSCKNATYKKYSSEIKEFTDQQYPDNNDIDVRSDLWDKYSHLNFEIKRNSTQDFTIIITPENQYSDSIILTGINILSWIPTVPKHVAKDDYLKSIEENEETIENSALEEITSETEITKRTILDQITFENYSYYLGFDKL